MSVASGLYRFMLLVIISSIAVGMGRVATTFYALHLGASNAQIGYIASLEAFGRLIVTLPAGFVIARYGARRIYALSNFIPMLFNAIMPWAGAWYVLAVLRGMICLSVPFRMVSLNSSFLIQLPAIGLNRAGWYRGAQSFGMSIAGPVLGGLLIENGGYFVCYFLVASLFGFMMIYGHRILPESEEEAEVTGKTSSLSTVVGELRDLWRIEAIRGACVIEFVNSLATTIFTTFILVLALTVAGLSQVQAVSLLTVQGVTLVLASFFLGYLLNLVPRERLQFLSILLSLTGLGLLGSCVNFIWLALGTLLLANGSALITLTRTAQLSQLQVNKSKLAAVYNLFNMSGSLVGAIFGGVLGDLIGLQQLFLMLIPLFLITLIGKIVRR